MGLFSFPKIPRWLPLFAPLNLESFSFFFFPSDGMSPKENMDR